MFCLIWRNRCQADYKSKYDPYMYLISLYNFIHSILITLLSILCETHNIATILSQYYVYIVNMLRHCCPPSTFTIRLSYMLTIYCHNLLKWNFQASERNVIFLKIDNYDAAWSSVLKDLFQFGSHDVIRCKTTQHTTFVLR